jgi:hypothetical protein
LEPNKNSSTLTEIEDLAMLGIDSNAVAFGKKNMLSFV